MSIDDLISWCGAPSTTAADLLRRAGRVVSRIATDGAKLVETQRRAAPYPDDAGELVAWHEARERWRREQIGSPVMDGLHLPRLPWGPEPVELIAELCAFALASLERIDALHREATEQRDRVAAQQVVIRDYRVAHERAESTAAATLAETLQEFGAWQDAAHAREASHRAELAAAIADAVQARQQARDAGRDRDVAVAQAEAWRASAAAAQDALHIMRTALRIPAPGDGAGLVVRGGS